MRSHALLSKAFDKEFSNPKVKPTRETLEKAGQIIEIARASNLKIDSVALAKYGAAVAKLEELLRNNCRRVWSY
jgi:hypothetical protein